VTDSRPKVVILGAGFAGLNAALGLRGADVDVTVIDRRNYHLFQPLLYQVATAGLSPADIASPIRAILSRQRNASVLMERVIGVDTTAHEVTTESRRIPYDYLIVATGARHAYFGHDDWEAFAPGLKTIDDATDIRRRILTAFENAEAAPPDTTPNLTFAVVGGGPTGVELAGAIAELAHRGLARDFRRIDPSMTRVLLIEAGQRILPTFPDSLSGNAEQQLARLRVEVHKGSAVTKCEAHAITLADGERIEVACTFWAAGVAASPAASWLAATADKVGQVEVTPFLTLPGHPEIFVIGDTASVRQPNGRQVPGVAPAAKQMGAYVADAIRRAVAGDTPPRPFRYRNYGNLATIGRKAAVADFGRIRLSGFIAWIVWSLAHIYFLIGFRNPAAVMLDWIWSYLTFGRGARLITGGI
jgi:NADH dehydrogenase